MERATPLRRNIHTLLKQQVSLLPKTNPNIGKFLEQQGFKAFDALHIASAESAQVDYFCTCDDRVLKKARQQIDLAVKILSPLEIAIEVNQ